MLRQHPFLHALSIEHGPFLLDVKKGEEPFASGLVTVEVKSDFLEKDHYRYVTAAQVGRLTNLLVQSGHKLEAGKQIGTCRIDHLHLEQPIITSLSGEVVEILVQNGQIIEYGQPLLKLLVTSTEGQREAPVSVEELEELLSLFKDINLEQLKIEALDQSFYLCIDRQIKEESTLKRRPESESNQKRPERRTVQIRMPKSADVYTSDKLGGVSEGGKNRTLSLEQTKLSLLEIQSPMVGTFYQAPGTGEQPFVTVGQNIEASTVVGIVEAMKLFNEVEAGISGEICDVLVENGQFVKQHQPLFLVKPLSE